MEVKFREGSHYDLIFLQGFIVYKACSQAFFSYSYTSSFLETPSGHCLELQVAVVNETGALVTKQGRFFGGWEALFIEWIYVYKNESICNILPGTCRHKNISITLSVTDPSATLNCLLFPTRILSTSTYILIIWYYSYLSFTDQESEAQGVCPKPRARKWRS